MNKLTFFLGLFGIAFLVGAIIGYLIPGIPGVVLAGCFGLAWGFFFPAFIMPYPE